MQKNENKWHGKLADPLYRATLIDAMEQAAEELRACGGAATAAFFDSEAAELARNEALYEAYEKAGAR